MINQAQANQSKTLPANATALSDTDLNTMVGGLGQDGSDLLIWNSGDGSDFLESNNRDRDGVNYWLTTRTVIV